MILSILLEVLYKIKSLNFRQEVSKKEFLINALKNGNLIILACGPI